MTFGVHPSHEMSSKSEAICETIQKERQVGFVTSHCCPCTSCTEHKIWPLPVHHILVYYT